MNLSEVINSINLINLTKGDFLMNSGRIKGNYFAPIRLIL